MRRITFDEYQQKSQRTAVDGKPDAIGDAIQEYEYTTAGNKEITLTIIDSNGKKASTKSIVILKDSPRTVDFMPSLSESTIGSVVDFTANANGQIDDYIWTF